METKEQATQRRHAYYLSHKEKWTEYRSRISKDKWREYGANWRKENPNGCAIRTKRWREHHPEKDKEAHRKYKSTHKDIIKGKNKKYYDSHIELMRARTRKYHAEHREEEREYLRLHPEWAILRHALEHMLESVSMKKTAKSVQYIGCSPSELRTHLEAQFKSGMTWDNYGKWHVDHIVPLSWWDFSLPENIFKASHYSNLQPLWGVENISKGDRYSGPYREKPGLVS